MSGRSFAVIAQSAQFLIQKLEIMMKKKLPRLTAALLMLGATASQGADLTLATADSRGVTASITPAAGESGIVNIYMAAVYNGTTFFRGPTTTAWSAYTSGDFPIAASVSLTGAPLTLTIADFDLSALPGLDLYVGYGVTPADLSKSNHVAKVYTVPTPSPTTTTAAATTTTTTEATTTTVETTTTTTAVDQVFEGAIYFGNEKNNSWTIVSAIIATINGQGGVDTVKLGTSLRKEYKIYKTINGAVNIDIISGGSKPGSFHLTLIDCEILTFDSGRDVLDLRTFFQ